MTNGSNYTQLARELRAAFNPTGTEGREVTVCDYGSTDSDWDDTIDCSMRRCTTS